MMSAVAEKFDHEGQWVHWQNALAGNVEPTPPGAAMSGFYRTRHGAAVAVWRDEAATLFCQSSGTFQPRTAEQIDQTITGDGCRAIPHEVYTAFVETGRWPDDIEPAPERGMGDNSASLAPHEQMVADVRDLLERFQSWLKTIGGKIASEEQDAKAAKYAKAIGEIEKKADTTHKAEKAPWLEGGRVVDSTWKPIIAEASQAKKTILAPTTAYRVARAEAEKKVRDAEIARQRAAQDVAKEQGERPAPVFMPPPKATGLRTVKRAVVTDLPALAAQLAGFKDPDPEFVEVCTKIAKRMLLANAEVKGAELKDEKVAA
jgi:hypothetical protein